MYDVAELAEVRRQVEARAAELLPTAAAAQEPAAPSAPGGQTDPTLPPPAACIRLAEAELSAASLHPPCIVDHYLYADVALLVAAGGAGKTTLLIYEAVLVALGRPVYGLAVLRQGWTLIITAEDRRETYAARLREILEAMDDLTAEDRRTVLNRIAVWDVTGLGLRLARAAAGNMTHTDLADQIVTAYRDDPPVMVVFDPLVSFGAGEAMVNDAEQAAITAARRIVRGLSCCCRMVHHTGQAAARAGTRDQYAGRGGSALADGARMVAVLTTWRPESDSGLRPPPGCHADGNASLTVLSRPKLSYAPPNLPRIWIRRDGWRYDSTPELAVDPAVELRGHANQILRHLTAELREGRYHTRRTLDGCLSQLGMTRAQLRDALAELQVAGRITEEPLPADRRQGSRKTYLAPAHRAGTGGAVEHGEMG